MKKESKASKITNVFNTEGLDELEMLAKMANQISAPQSEKKAIVLEKAAVEEILLKKDRRFTIILPHDLYMKMVLKTKSNGISFTKYIHRLMEKDLS